jgi:drug/metabolite transporter (DMT)-like permease
MAHRGRSPDNPDIWGWAPKATQGMAATPGFGELCSILSALAWAVGIILYRQLGAQLPPLRLNILKNLLVFGMLVPAIALVHGLALPRFTGLQAAAAVGSGILGIGLADTLYFRALNVLGAGRMGVIGNFYSPFVIALSFAFLGERLRAAQVAGFVFVSIGVWVAAWPRGDGPDPVAQAAGVEQRTPRPSRVDVSDTRHGLLSALAAIVLMAVSVVMVKRTLESQPLLWVTAFRMAGAMAAMALFRPWRSRARTAPTRGVGVPWLRLAGAAFVGSSWRCYCGSPATSSHWRRWRRFSTKPPPSSSSCWRPCGWASR